MRATARSKWFPTLIILGILVTPFITWADGTGEDMTTCIKHIPANKSGYNLPFKVAYYQIILGLKADLPDLQSGELYEGQSSCITDNLDDWWLKIEYKSEVGGPWKILYDKGAYEAGKNYVVSFWVDHNSFRPYFSKQ